MLINLKSVVTLASLLACAEGFSSPSCSEKYDALPENPIAPHDYFDLPSKFMEIPSQDSGQPIRIHYKSIGKGSPLLLLHGLMTDGYSFRYVISELARSYEVIVPDLPGAGLSDSPAQASMTPQWVASVLRDILDTLGLEKVYLVGNSLGGYEALWSTLLHPDRVRKLVVIHSPGLPDLKTHGLKVVTSLPGAHRLFRHLVDKCPQDFVIKNVHYLNPSIMSREEVDHYAEVFRDEDRTDLLWRVLRNSMDPRHMNSLERLLKQYGSEITSRVPIRLLWATQDPLASPKVGPWLKEHLPGAELSWFENSYHFLQVELPERMIEAITSFDRFGGAAPN